MTRNLVRIPAPGRAAACRAAISLAATLLISLAPPPVHAQPPETEYRGAAALGLALRRLGNTARVLVIAAHPDDENTPLLSTLALERGADVAYLSLTRGEGGQNAIGPELQEALGILRTEELLAARRLDGPAQFFTRAYDFGFSKSAQEVFRHWPRDTILADVVRIVRAFRPDVVVSIFSGTPRDGHGQHQAAGILAHEAFAAAGDPARFPEQFAEGLLPHTPRKLYQAPWRGADRVTVQVATGQLDPLVGRSPFQIAMASRSRHRSQEMGQLERPGPASLALVRVGPDGAPLPGEEPSLFAGIDTTLAQRAATLGAAAVTDLLTEYDAAVRAVRGELDALRPARLVPGLARAAALLARADSLLAARPRGDAAAHTLRFYIAREAEDVNHALALASGLVLDAVANDGTIVPGQTFRLELTVWNGGEAPARVRALAPELPEGWSARLLETCAPAAGRSRAGDSGCSAGTLGDPLAPGALLIQRYEVSVPATAPVTEPYYLRRPRSGDVYRWPADPSLAGLPFEPAPVHGRAEIEAAGARVVLHREAMHRFVDGTLGEVRRPIMVVPAVSVTLEPGVAILPLGAGTAVAPAGNGTGTGSGSAAGEAPSASPGGRTRAAARATAGAAAGSEATSPAAPGPALSFRVRLAAEAPNGVAGALRLVLPTGWRAVPEAVPVRFGGPGETHVVEIAAHPPADLPAGDYPVQAVFEAEDGRRYARGLQLVDYPHTRPRPLYREARASVRAFDVRVPAGLRVGYIAGPGDAVPQALAQLGVAIDLLDEAALSGAGAPGATTGAAERTGAAPAAPAAAGLARYDVIVVGPRAYESRPDLAANNGRLLDYVREGGTLIVQYNQYEWSDGGYAPYPLSIARPHDRVTDETAPVRLLDPTHPALSYPNRITDADFEGWVQERGLYFPRTWDERYTPLLEMADPGEEAKRGALLVAAVGRGTYVYTGLALFRQLPAGVPGAYRLFANLLALGERRAP